jgi:prepilin-type N-terminal cleavage/methylation domain-containing protein
MKQGFTLIEILVYIGVLAILVLAISSFLVWAIKLNAKMKAMREVLDNAQRVMDILGYEIKLAKSIYTPTTSLTQLSLETTHQLPSGEETTFVDFYPCQQRLCLKRENQEPLTLTSEKVEASWKFYQVFNDSVPSLRVDLRVVYKNSQLPEYQASLGLSSAFSLRNY